jgi:hypothetical protein
MKDLQAHSSIRLIPFQKNALLRKLMIFGVRRGVRKLQA